ncbi:hypothetical protein [Nonomuraea sp. NPDC049141]|uniref:hypothetical protein n=1 Tax=Nonomuraea sp. NPDC049141 TaxID=3155500 RepID=UPI0033C41DB1
MADFDELIQMRRDFLAAQERLATAGREIPSQAAVAAGAEPATEEQQEAWLALQGECRRLAVAIQEHKYWREVDDPKAARKALEDAAKAGGDEPPPTA